MEESRDAAPSTAAGRLKHPLFQTAPLTLVWVTLDGRILRAELEPGAARLEELGG